MFTIFLEESLDLSVYFLNEILLLSWTRLDLYRHSEAQKNYILWDILSSKKLHNIYSLYGKRLATQEYKARLFLGDGFTKKKLWNKVWVILGLWSIKLSNWQDNCPIWKGVIVIVGLPNLHLTAPLVFWEWVQYLRALW